MTDPDITSHEFQQNAVHSFEEAERSKEETKEATQEANKYKKVLRKALKRKLKDVQKQDADTEIVEVELGKFLVQGVEEDKIPSCPVKDMAQWFDPQNIDKYKQDRLKKNFKLVIIPNEKADEAEEEEQTKRMRKENESELEAQVEEEQE